MPEIRETFDFGPKTRGIDYVVHDGAYHGVVESGDLGNGYTCFYPEGKKVYIVTSGEVLGERVEADCDVFLLDLREKGIDLESLTDSKVLMETVEANREAIRRVKLEPGVPFEIEPGILHQTRGVGILDIQVESGYRNDTEIADVFLSDYYQKEEK